MTPPVPPIPQRKPTTARPPISPTPPPIPDKISSPQRSPSLSQIQEVTHRSPTITNPASVNKTSPNPTVPRGVASPMFRTVPSPSPGPQIHQAPSPSSESHAVPSPPSKFHSLPNGRTETFPSLQDSPLRPFSNRPRITERIRPPPRSPGTPQPAFWNSSAADTAELQLRAQPPQPPRPQEINQPSPSRPPRTDASPAGK